MRDDLFCSRVIADLIAQALDQNIFLLDHPQALQKDIRQLFKCNWFLEVINEMEFDRFEQIVYFRIAGHQKDWDILIGTSDVFCNLYTTHGSHFDIQHDDMNIVMIFVERHRIGTIFGTIDVVEQGPQSAGGRDSEDVIIIRV